MSTVDAGVPRHHGPNRPQRPDVRTDALRDAMSELLAMDQAADQIAATMCGLDIHYELGAGRPLLGRAHPDLDVQTTGGSLRIFELPSQGPTDTAQPRHARAVQQHHRIQPSSSG